MTASRPIVAGLVLGFAILAVALLAPFVVTPR
jgi:hypothetical protein